jgi:hypothetical protein
MARREAERIEAEYEASTNQVRHEPVPASHDDQAPDAARRSEESAARAARQPGTDDQDHSADNAG